MADEETGGLRLVLSVPPPERPIMKIASRLRLGTLIRRARVKAEKSPGDLARLLGISNVLLAQVERGMLPLGTDALRMIADDLRCDYEALVEASREFQLAIFTPTEGVTVDGIKGEARLTDNPVRAYFDYREGWIAGTSGRPMVKGMSHDWKSGWGFGCDAFTAHMEMTRSSLGLPADESLIVDPEDDE